MKERKNITYPDWLRASHQFDNIELFQKSATASRKFKTPYLRQIIEQARGHVAATSHFVLTMMYWHICEQINRKLKHCVRSAYYFSEEEIVSATQRQYDDNNELFGEG